MMIYKLNKKICYIFVFSLIFAQSPMIFADTATSTPNLTLAISSANNLATTTLTMFATTSAALSTSSSQIILSSTTIPSIFAVPTFNQNNPVDIEKLIHSYFANIPIMIPIAKCESGFRQFNSDGTVLYGGTGSMIGIYQISSGHTSKAQAMGMDITTVNGNIAYARYLYTNQNTEPWISSIDCWNTSSASQSQVSNIGSLLNKNLSFGMIDPQIFFLQKLLNRIGFPIAVDGPGSAGNETNKFGNLTRTAVRNFQCSKNITCTGNEYTDGYGLVNNRTRIALIELDNLSITNTVMALDNTSTTSNISTGTTNSLDSTDITSLLTKIKELLAIVASLQKQLALQTNH